MSYSFHQNIKFHNYISSIQKVVVYETRARLYLVGSNNKESRFRLLEIDRTSPDLKYFEHQGEFEKRELVRLLPSNLKDCRPISAYGVLGFVRFTSCHYLILVTKRTMCALIGMHIIYTIKDTVMIKINEGRGVGMNPMEQKFLKLFTNVDMNSNFYFSYSYNLSRTLQYNMAPPRFIEPDGLSRQNVDGIVWESMEAKSRMDFSVRGTSRKRFIWNEFLMQPVKGKIHPDWLLEITHGFVSQSHISIFGRPIYVCLIARRSNRFAGTRFLRRGANFVGDVANEVETEQIVTDGARLCSFVQMRGSVPHRWSQDISKMVPKPQIMIDLSDPYSEIAGRHFQKLFFHYGAPIICLNLVKKREKRMHENILTSEMVGSIKYLNQFLSVDHRIKYIHFDMAKRNRDGKVMKSLADIAERVIQQTGIFLKSEEQNLFQTGIIRVNCVDCLDRTNTAQFSIGKCVLGHQLHKLGFINSPKLEFDSDCITMLESLYEDHGDTLALQYGGSQLVHRIKTYRKTAPWTSQGNDIMQTLSRYYSNTFSDTEKQHSINLFLGYYVPIDFSAKDLQTITDIPTDHYYLTRAFDPKFNENPLTQFISDKIARNLPHSCSNANKIVKELVRIESPDIDMVDVYSNYHQPHKITTFEETIAYQISQISRHFVSTFKTNFSPFEPGRRREDRITNNPSMTGQSSTGSTNSSTTDEDSNGSQSENDSENETKVTQNTLQSQNFVEKPKLPLSSTRESYGIELQSPSKENMKKYKDYIALWEYSSKLNAGGKVDLTSKFEYKMYPEIKVSEESRKIYENYCNLPNNLTVKDETRVVIAKYVASL
ncbi:polyphosphoinositide phosphatase [Culicoides brevitarsis]|uniref:polyphosphoinositide phosphatase n=1 Tax=Culicoides brevitarsis TaxID=469753 RepID=UPI00307BE9CB